LDNLYRSVISTAVEKSVNIFFEKQGSIFIGSESPAIRCSPHEKFGAVAAVGFIELWSVPISKKQVPSPD
jgi:hypothetical protein